MNRRELKVLHKYLKAGWKVVRCGSPDFLFYKDDSGEIQDVKFVEVKSESDKLTGEQHMYKHILEKHLHAPYSVEIVE